MNTITNDMIRSEKIRIGDIIKDNGAIKSKIIRAGYSYMKFDKKVIFDSSFKKINYYFDGIKLYFGLCYQKSGYMKQVVNYNDNYDFTIFSAIAENIVDMCKELHIANLQIDVKKYIQPYMKYTKKVQMELYNEMFNNSQRYGIESLKLENDKFLIRFHIMKFVTDMAIEEMLNDESYSSFHCPNIDSNDLKFIFKRYELDSKWLDTDKNVRYWFKYWMEYNYEINEIEETSTENRFEIDVNLYTQYIPGYYEEYEEEDVLLKNCSISLINEAIHEYNELIDNTGEEERVIKIYHDSVEETFKDEVVELTEENLKEVSAMIEKNNKVMNVETYEGNEGFEIIITFN